MFIPERDGVTDMTDPRTPVEICSDSWDRNQLTQFTSTCVGCGQYLITREWFDTYSHSHRTCRDCVAIVGYDG